MKNKHKKCTPKNTTKVFEQIPPAGSLCHKHDIKEPTNLVLQRF